MNAKLVIVTWFSLDGTGIAFSLLPRTGSSRNCCILPNWHSTLVDSTHGNCVLKIFGRCYNLSDICIANNFAYHRVGILYK